MDLFEVVNGRAVPSTHALMLKPYKTIWLEDDTEGKTYSIGWFSYIEFTCSPKRSNIFWGYSEVDRPLKVKEHIFGNANELVPDEIMFATIAYKEHLEHASTAYATFMEAEANLTKARVFLNEVNLNARTSSGAFALKPKEYLLAMRELPESVKKVEELRSMVNTDLSKISRTRKDREPGDYEE